MKFKESKVLRKVPCPACRKRGEDRAGDNMAEYDDGHSYCHKCGYWDKGSGVRGVTTKTQSNKRFEMTGVAGPIKDRKISQTIVEKFGVTLEYSKDGTISKHHYPYFDKDTGEAVGTKVRTVKDKQFSTTGTFNNTGLFGQQAFSEGGKYITVVEGEADALAVSEIFDGRWPVVSIKRGVSAAAKDIKDSLEWLESFDNIIICFDNDKAGQKGAQDILPLFSPGKVKNVTLPLKDAGDMLKAGKVREFTAEWWNAKAYKPDGIVTIDDVIHELETTEEVECIDYPWECLNEKTYGFRQGELVTITSGSGMGKSQVVRELQHHLYKETKDNIGVMALEEVPKRSALGVASILANKPLHLPDRRGVISDLKGERIKWLKTIDNSRFCFWKHFGSSDEDNLFSRLRYMVKAYDCKWIILDHLSIIVSDQEGDERKAIDSIMTKLRTLVQELNIGLFLVSHLKRPQGKAHEEGGHITLAELRGSAAIAQLSDIVIGLERNQQHEDEEIRNTTTVRVLKNRFTGLTGPACYLYYDMETGRMSEVCKPDGAPDNEEF